MKNKLNTETFIERAREIHGDLYDYSKVEYINYQTKVCIICPIHGEFWMTPNNHLHKTNPRKCPNCQHRSFAYTRDEFIEKAKGVHGDKYDYSKVEYINNSTKVCIICLEHGEFWQRPSSHLKGFGCQACAMEVSPSNKKNITQFIEQATEIHGGKYDYSKVEYVNAHTKVCIICPEHGEFWQTPHKHINAKRGCPSCGQISSASKRQMTKEVFIQKAKSVHGDKYDYSKVEYNGRKNEVCIICPIHGEFWQTPSNHLNGNGCIKCNGGIQYTLDEFISKAKLIHGDKYDYSKVEYVNCFAKVCIICPIHGEFWQSPSKHLYGQGCKKCGQLIIAEQRKLTNTEFLERAREKCGGLFLFLSEYSSMYNPVLLECTKCGHQFYKVPNKILFGSSTCPKCTASVLESQLIDLFNSKEIKYNHQQRFEWLGKQSLDFYLPDYNVAIECQGCQHFQPVDYFGGDKEFQATIERDQRKKKLCLENGVKLLYFTNVKNCPNGIITNSEDLLQEILLHD